LDYIRETVFAGTNTGTVYGYNYIKQSYSVGVDDYLVNADGVTSIGSSGS